MNDPADPHPAAQAWFRSRSVKAKSEFRKHVTALLDALAPEKQLGKAVQNARIVGQHRSPDGCILQAPTTALQLSWHAEKDDSPGSLHVVLWNGVLSRRGAPRREGATVVSEEVYSPEEAPTDDRVWRGSDSTLYSSATLAEHCLALLERHSNG